MDFLGWLQNAVAVQTVGDTVPLTAAASGHVEALAVPREGWEMEKRDRLTRSAH